MFSANTSQVSADQVYVEDVFSTYLYTGTPAYAQTIVNGIDLAGKGGLLWIKSRTSDTAPDHYLNFNDGSNIVSNQSNNTSARQVMSPYVAFNSNGFYVNAAPGFLNNNGVNYTSWTFREAPKFFDVVTWTGNGSSGRTISHNLGVAPGCIIVKRTDTTSNWPVYQRAVGATKYLFLNAIQAAGTSNAFWNDTEPTSSVFTVGSDATVNANGGTYVAYLFAHDATTDGIIQCGGYTVPAGATSYDVNIGWEPQWMLVKRANGSEGWTILDNMRGWPKSPSVGAGLSANTADAEFNTAKPDITSTGFSVNDFSSFGTPGNTFVYIAIRRGPMRTPTSGTSVFAPVASSAAVTTQITTGFPVDLHLAAYRPGDSYNFNFTDRLRGMMQTTSQPTQKILISSSTGAEQAGSTSVGYEFWNTGWRIGGYYNTASTIYYDFRRAPSFFDVVCYTGTGSALTVNHNLGVVPELMIIKSRSATSQWIVYAQPQGISKYLLLSSNAAVQDDSSGQIWNFGTAPTASVFTVGTAQSGSSTTYVAYLFASCPGVSKVGTYTGNGSSQTINCGFAAGARFVMIKRTDAVGNWCVWDSARGINPGGDPVLQLNNTFAEDNTTDDVDTAASGFVVNSVSPGYEINLNGATYIYLAVA